MSVMYLLANDGFLTVNKYIARIYGLNAAVMMAELASLYLYWESNDGIDEDGMFYATSGRIEDDTTLSRYQQAQAIKILAADGILSVKRKGAPARQYFKFDEGRLLQILNNKSLKNFKTRLKETCNQELKKLEPNNNREIRIENKNKIIDPKEVRKIIPPPIEWVEEYCRSRGNTVDAQVFYDFYESKGWVIGKSKMKDWQAAVRTWERNRHKKQRDALAAAWKAIEVECNERDNGGRYPP